MKYFVVSSLVVLCLLVGCVTANTKGSTKKDWPLKVWRIEEDDNYNLVEYTGNGKKYVMIHYNPYPTYYHAHSQLVLIDTIQE